MALISGGVPNLHQGVSQQPDPLRDPTQGDLQVNGVSSPIGGLRKREGSYALKKISNTAAPFERVAIHHIRRDDVDQYMAVISRSTVRVFRVDNGAEIPVTLDQSAKSYLSTAGDASLDFRCVTIGDITFVSNFKNKPAMQPSLTPLKPRPTNHEALVWVKAANYGQVYQLSVNGVTAKVETAISPTTTNADGLVVANRISPEDVAERLRASLTGGYTTGIDLGGGQVVTVQLQPNIPCTRTQANSANLGAQTNGEGTWLTGVVYGDGTKVTNIQWDFSKTTKFVVGEVIYFTEGQLNGTDSTNPVFVGTVTKVTGPKADKTAAATNVKTYTDRGGSGLTVNLTFGSGYVTAVSIGNEDGSGYGVGDRIYVKRSDLFTGNDTSWVLVGTIKSVAGKRLTGVDIWISRSTLYLTSSNAMTILATGGLNNSDIGVITDRVQSPTELPAVAPEGYVVEIEGDKANKVDSYYVRFASLVTSFGTGLWEETAANGVEFRLNRHTMPHLLVRGIDGNNFWFGPAVAPGEVQPFPGAVLPVWGQRVSGDYTSNPTPSFVGAGIKDIFVYNNRLCFLSGESVNCSRAGKFYDFFRETVAVVLDSDPVDLSASQDQISYLTYAVPFQDEMILFSKEVQFRLHSGGDTFTAATARIDVLTNYQCDLGVRPVPMAGALVFPQWNGDWTQFREFRIYGSGTAINADGTDITTQVMDYIPAGVRFLVVNEAANILVALSDKDCYTNRLYVYKFLNESDGGSAKRTQSSWSYWEFCTDEIKAIMMVDQSIYMVCKYGEEIWLDVLPTADRPRRVPLGAAQSDEPLLTPHEIYLDRKFTNTLRSAAGARVPQGVYNAITDTTTWILPFMPRCRVQAWTSYIGKDICAPCVTIESASDATVSDIPCVTVAAVVDSTTEPTAPDPGQGSLTPPAPPPPGPGSPTQVAADGMLSIRYNWEAEEFSQFGNFWSTGTFVVSWYGDLSVTFDQATEYWTWTSNDPRNPSRQVHLDYLYSNRTFFRSSAKTYTIAAP